MNHSPADDDQRRYMQNKEKNTASTKAFLALFIFFRPNNFRILIQILFIARILYIQQHMKELMFDTGQVVAAVTQVLSFIVALCFCT